MIDEDESISNSSDSGMIDDRRRQIRGDGAPGYRVWYDMVAHVRCNRTIDRYDTNSTRERNAKR